MASLIIVSNHLNVNISLPSRRLCHWGRHSQGSELKVLVLVHLCIILLDILSMFPPIIVLLPSLWGLMCEVHVAVVTEVSWCSPHGLYKGGLVG